MNPVVAADVKFCTKDVGGVIARVNKLVQVYSHRQEGVHNHIELRVDTRDDTDDLLHLAHV